MSSLHSNFFQPTFLGYLSVITLLGVLVHGNRTFQADLQEVRDVMPKLADFLEEGLVKRLNNLEGRIQGLEMSVCRCGLGPLGQKKGGGKETDEERKTEDMDMKNGTDKKDKKKKGGKEYDAEEATREETIGEGAIRYAKLEL